MKKELDDKYWNNRYKNNEFGWDVGQISEPLKQYFSQIKNKQISILIPGAGNAYEAEYLVQNGFTNVYVCDFAEEPLKNLKARCPKINNENLLLVNFFEINQIGYGSKLVDGTLVSAGPFIFDLIVEQTFFCAIDPSFRKKYFEKMHSLLKPKGKLVGLLFDAEFEVSPPFGGHVAEYKEYIKGLFKINVFEKCYNSIKPREGKELFINLEK